MIYLTLLFALPAVANRRKRPNRVPSRTKPKLTKILAKNLAFRLNQYKNYHELQFKIELGTILEEYDIVSAKNKLEGLSGQLADIIRLKNVQLKNIKKGDFEAVRQFLIVNGVTIEDINSNAAVWDEMKGNFDNFEKELKIKTLVAKEVEASMNPRIQSTSMEGILAGTEAAQHALDTAMEPGNEFVPNIDANLGNPSIDVGSNVNPEEWIPELPIGPEGKTEGPPEKPIEIPALHLIK
eukprot:NODE_582_length_5738_cov_0.811314.p2 type:complete len:239 gc:universal NODE_582_length_5738_cov_0.811314:4168-4884(+)